MGHLTIKAEIHRRQRSDGKHQVRVRLTKDRVAAYLGLMPLSTGPPN